MLFEPTTLAATSTALAAALETYGADARLVFSRAGLDIDDLCRPGARYPFSAMTRLWRESRRATNDPCIGLVAARRIKPQALQALGMSWMASGSLYDGFCRMVRYSRIANTSLRVAVTERAGRIGISPALVDTNIEPAPEAVDASLAFLVTLCRSMTDNHFAPLEVRFRHEDTGHIDQYIQFFDSPVFFAQESDVVYVDAETAHRRVRGGNEELAKEVDRLADRYLATLEPNKVQDHVREILLTLLPSGDTDQQAVARRLNRSVSALQRQLRAEGSTYRQVLDETRHSIALRLIREHQYSLGQIAYLLGFSDQANFSRAFKRWTGRPPTEYRVPESARQASGGSESLA